MPPRKPSLGLDAAVSQKVSRTAVHRRSPKLELVGWSQALSVSERPARAFRYLNGIFCARLFLVHLKREVNQFVN